MGTTGNENNAGATGISGSQLQAAAVAESQAIVKFDDDTGHAMRPHRLLAGPEDLLSRRAPGQDHPRRIDEFLQGHGRKRVHRIPVTHPDHRPGQARCDDDGKDIGAVSHHFMQASPAQADWTDDRKIIVIPEANSSPGTGGNVLNGLDPLYILVLFLFYSH